MKLLIALSVLSGALSPAMAQLPSAQDFLTQTKKALQQQQEAPPPSPAAPTATAPAPAPRSLSKACDFRTNCDPKTGKAPAPQVPTPAPVGMAPECDKTRTLLGLCPKGSVPYGSEPQAAVNAPAPTAKRTSGYALRSGESPAQCEKRLNGHSDKLTKASKGALEACNPNAGKGVDTGY